MDPLFAPRSQPDELARPDDLDTGSTCRHPGGRGDRGLSRGRAWAQLLDVGTRSGRPSSARRVHTKGRLPGCHHRILAQRGTMGRGLAYAKERIDMECLYCKGTLIRKQVSYTATRKGYHLIIDRVPAWVCEQCGEPLYEEETVDAIQQVLQGVDARLAEAAPLFTPA